MSGTVFRLCPVGGYDIPALEIWLEKMAGKGLVFDCTAGPLTLFARQEPAPLRFHLEPAHNKTDQEDPELTDLFRAAGWSYLGIFRKNFFVFATADRAAQAHTDPDVLDYAIRRFFKQKLLGGHRFGNRQFSVIQIPISFFQRLFSVRSPLLLGGGAGGTAPSPGCWPCWAFCW